MMPVTPLTLTTEWDKTFSLDPHVTHSKVTFANRFGITLAADLYLPEGASADGAESTFAAVAVSGPFGAVKEQCSGLYAHELARRGFIALAFDPSFTGESSGEPRHVASPDINTEDFSAAVDFLSTHPAVNPEQIGILGICGWGGLALNAATIDTRIKATVSSTMYDMTRVSVYGYFDSMDKAGRAQMRVALNSQRTEDFRAGSYQQAGGVPDELPKDAPDFVKDYFAYYKTPRGYHPRSLNSNNGWNTTSTLSFMNAKMLAFTDEITSPVLVVHGDQAHSYYFSKDAFAQLEGDNKEFVAIEGATHTDLYDQLDKIPFDKIDAFFTTHLTQGA